MRNITTATIRSARTRATNTAQLFGFLADATPKPPKEHLVTAAFNNCCGINIIYGFPGTSTSGMGSRPNFRHADVLSELNEKTRDSVGYGLSLVAINNHQVDLWDGYMTEAGYHKLVADFYHPGHGNKLTLYGYVHHPKNKNKKGEVPIEISSRHRDEPAEQSG